MSKDENDHVEVEGVISEALGGGQYSVKLLEGGAVRARLGGKMKKNHIRVLPGDHVKVKVSPYDTSHGFITFRTK